MDTQNIILDIFRYFAKFVGRAGVMRNFVTGKTDTYNNLKNFCQALPEVSAIPDITDYVFGVNETSVNKRIGNIKGIYLFVDYGNFQSSQNAQKVKTDELYLAVTVAKPLNIETIDLAEEIVLANQLLNITRTIRKNLLNDKTDPFVQLLSFPTEITPWFSRELNNSTGWTMLFKLSGIEIL